MSKPVTNTCLDEEVYTQYIHYVLICLHLLEGENRVNK
jgi:hypothetical protein